MDLMCPEIPFCEAGEADFCQVHYNTKTEIEDFVQRLDEMVRPR